MKGSLNIILFSIDFVFIELIKRILDQYKVKHLVAVKSLFSESKNILNTNHIDLIIVDDPIIGTSSYELISFLRLNQKIVSPIVYFGAAEYGGERKALLTGASYFFKKPFNPKDVSKIFKEILLKSKD